MIGFSKAGISQPHSQDLAPNFNIFFKMVESTGEKFEIIVENLMDPALFYKVVH